MRLLMLKVDIVKLVASLKPIHPWLCVCLPSICILHPKCIGFKQPCGQTCETSFTKSTQKCTTEIFTASVRFDHGGLPRARTHVCWQICHGMMKWACGDKWCRLWHRAFPQQGMRICFTRLVKKLCKSNALMLQNQMEYKQIHCCDFYPSRQRCCLIK